MHGSLPQPRAVHVINAVDMSTPWYSRSEFVECIAAVASLYPEEMDKTSPGPNKKVLGTI